MLGKPVSPVTFDDLYLRLDSGNAMAGDINSDTDGAYDIGSTTLRFGQLNSTGILVHGGNGTAVNTNDGYIIGKTDISGTSTGTATLTSVPDIISGASQVTFLVGTVQTGDLSGGDATIDVTGVCCMVVGASIVASPNDSIINVEGTGAAFVVSAFNFVAGTDTVDIVANGSLGAILCSGGFGGVGDVDLTGSALLTAAAISGSNSFTATLDVTGTAVLVAGQATGSSANADITVSGIQLAGVLIGGLALNATIQATASGSLAFGLATWDSIGTTGIEALAEGAFAFGLAYGGWIRATGTAGMATGATGLLGVSFPGADIIASGDGSRAHGLCGGVLNAWHITASGDGAWAIGFGDTGPITASADNSFQLGTGINDEEYSIKVGAKGIGIWIRGLDGAFGVQNNGQIWTDSGDVVVRSNAHDVSVDLNQNYTVTGGYTPDRAFDPTSTTLTEVAHILATLIDDHIAAGQAQ